MIAARRPSSLLLLPPGGRAMDRSASHIAKLTTTTMTTTRGLGSSSMSSMSSSLLLLPRHTMRLLSSSSSSSSSSYSKVVRTPPSSSWPSSRRRARWHNGNRRCRCESSPCVISTPHRIAHHSSSSSSSLVSSASSSYSSSSTLAVGTQTKTMTTRAAGVLLLLLVVASDPVVSAYEDTFECLGTNASHWKLAEEEREGGGGRDEGEKKDGDAVVGMGGLRNAHLHRQSNRHRRLNPNRHGECDDDDDDCHDRECDHRTAPPRYCRVVVVGGGMAGLHTALALAEGRSRRIMRVRSDRTTGDADPPRHRRAASSRGGGSSWREWLPRMPAGWTTMARPPTATVANADDGDGGDDDGTYIDGDDVIVLDSSTIGNGASGRAMGWIGRGYQVPMESLLANAIDYRTNDDDVGDGTSAAVVRTSVPMLLRNAHALVHRLGLIDAPPPRRYDVDAVRAMHELTAEGYERVRDLVQSYGIDCDWTEGGGVYGSICDGGIFDEADDGSRALTSVQVNNIMGRPSVDDGLYRGGVYDPNCGSVNPLRLTLGLADAVERWGVRIYEKTKAIKVEKRTNEEGERPRRRKVDKALRREGGGNDEGVGERCDRGRYAVITDGGNVVRCDHVVLCTGAASTTRDVSRRLSHSFLPFYTYMTATEPLGKRCPLRDGALEEELSRSGARSSDDIIADDGSKMSKRQAQPIRAPTYGDDHLILNYWRGSGTESNNTDDEGSSRSRVLFGSLGDTYPLPAWLVSLRLRNALSEVYPQLRDVRFDSVWGGKLAFSPNSMPLIGRDVDFDCDDDDADGEVELTEGGVWYATAFAGHGIIPTAVAGSLIADAILGTPDRQQWKLFHEHFPPSSWNGYPFSRLGAGAVLTLYNVGDWLGKRGVPLPNLPDLW